MKATKDNWKNEPLPDQRTPLGYERYFNDLQGERMQQGYVPRDMDDKWFIYFEAGWLNFHRSWTGHCIYQLKLDGSPAGVRVIESWVNSNRDQNNVPDLEKNREILNSLIDNYLLNADDS